MTDSLLNARDAEAYEVSMGRWSRQMAPLLIDFAGIADGERILEVGCGTGSLTFALAAAANVASIEAIDVSPVYLAEAQRRNTDPRITIGPGDVCALPFPDASFDRAVSQLVLQFVPDTARALAEMRRVVRPGGVIAAAVWNTSGGQPHQRLFWDTAAMLDPAAAAARAKSFFRPMTQAGDLRAAWERAGLIDVIEGSLTIQMDHPSFDDFWQPIATGEGTLGKYVGSLSEGDLARLKRHVRDAYESGRPDGRRVFSAVAWACKGTVPG
jgi:ubiquinone/menaquinone biosynthesis C-methylase UbiE